MRLVGMVMGMCLALASSAGAQTRNLNAFLELGGASVSSVGRKSSGELAAVVGLQETISHGWGTRLTGGLFKRLNSSECTVGAVACPPAVPGDIYALFGEGVIHIGDLRAEDHPVSLSLGTGIARSGSSPTRSSATSVAVAGGLELTLARASRISIPIATRLLVLPKLDGRSVAIVPFTIGFWF